MPDCCRVEDDRAPQTRDVLGPLRQRAIADDRVVGIRQDVEHGRVVERDADRLQLGRQRRREALGETLVAAPSERVHRRPHGKGRLETRDAAAFLIDAHPERQLVRQRLRLARNLRDLLRLDDVPGEQDDAAEIELAREGAQVRRDRLARKSRDCELTDVPAKIAHAHS